MVTVNIVEQLANTTHFQSAQGELVNQLHKEISASSKRRISANFLSSANFLLSV